MATVDDTYGLDYSTFPAADLTYRKIGGPSMLAEQAARRITTPAGALRWDATGTLDAKDWINDDLTPADLRAREKLIESLFDPDPRMEVVAALRFEAQDLRGELFIDLEITPTEGETFTVTIEAGTGAMTITGTAVN